jgi:hypothetical protein
MEERLCERKKISCRAGRWRKKNAVRKAGRNYSGRVWGRNKINKNKRTEGTDK